MGPDDTAPAPAAEGVEKLRALRATRAGKKPAATSRRRTASTRPAGTKPAAAKKATTSPGVQIATTIKLVSGVVELRAPVHAAVVRSQADDLGGILDRLAEQDPRVREFLERITGVTKSAAWVELGMWTIGTGAALAYASGVQHPVALMLGGSLATAAATEVATRIVAGEAAIAGTDYIDPAAVERVTALLLAPRTKPTADDEETPDA